MPVTHIPSESELMEVARLALKRRVAIVQLYPPAEPAKPRGDEAAPSPETTARRQRSLQTCHRYNLYERPRHRPPPESGAYVPELSARIENDRNLTDGARRLARKLAELIYRQNREARCTEITVTYLMKALHRSRRTVQRYLRLLEREGYIRTEVMRGARSRLCTGLAVALCPPLLARHHEKQWPRKRRNPGASKESQNYKTQRFKGTGERLTIQQWFLICSDGVFRALMKSDSLGVTETPPPLKAEASP